MPNSKRSIGTIILACVLYTFTSAQPWKNPIMIARSNDGKIFNTPTIFQDSSGVPCVVRWKSDTLIATFQ
ncbi:MAG TPA: hypothetical protein VKH37_01415, partial [Ferruginibacter sp.]|nr:hypothetical protein [Ferruginibacter sp.]